MEHYIEAENLSMAWYRAFEQVTQVGIDAVRPLTVAITRFDQSQPLEVAGVRQELDEYLETHGQHESNTVANTIFPKSLWNPLKNRERLYLRYRQILPKLKKIPANRNGLYFERMIDYGSDRMGRRVNQLDHIITTFHGGNHRTSALQALIFDPYKDHTNQRQRGFPCMQQVTFEVIGPKRDQLIVTAHYATQHLYNKAYGNYLGVCRLGEFMAEELGRLTLSKVNFVVSAARLGDKITKTEARTLLARLQPHVSAFNSSQPLSQGQLLTA